MIIWLEDDTYYSDLFIPIIYQAANDDVKVLKNPDEFDIFIKDPELARQIKLLIIDIQMAPGKSIDKHLSNGGSLTGFVFLKQIKQNDTLKDIPIIVWTNKDDNTVNQYCTQHQIPYIKKEASYKNLIQKIHKTYDK